MSASRRKLSQIQKPKESGKSLRPLAKALVDLAFQLLSEEKQTDEEEKAA